MCILLYVKLIWCSGIPYIYGQLEEGTSHIYLGQMYPLQLTIDVWNTATPKKFHI